MPGSKLNSATDSTHGSANDPANDPAQKNAPIIDHNSFSWALILAAGFSSRMSGFKPLLPLGGETVLSRVAATYRRAGINNIIVVSGYRAMEVETEAARLNLRCVRNPGAPANRTEPADFKPYFDMFSSVLTGFKSLPAEAKQVFVHPVDVPLVCADTIARLLRKAGEEYDKSDGSAARPVLLPVFNGEPGHPPVLPASIFEAVLTYTGTGGLRGFLATRPNILLEMEDQNILFDMDTDAEYAEAQRRIAAQGDTFNFSRMNHF